MNVFSRSHETCRDQIDIIFDLASRIPGLRSLAIRGDDMTPLPAKSFQEAFRGNTFQSLEKIEIPRSVLITELLRILYRLPQPVEVTCSKSLRITPLHIYPTSIQNGFNLDIGLSEGAFPGISTLSLVRTIPSALQFLNGFLPRTLQKLCIEPLTAELPASARVLLERAAEKQPPLSGIHFSDDGALDRHDRSLVEPLRFISLKFLNLKDIRIFTAS